MITWINKIHFTEKLTLNFISFDLNTRSYDDSTSNIPILKSV